ncbi:MAG: DedA family protein [Hyphomicrobiaceae bacterium]
MSVQAWWNAAIEFARDNERFIEIVLFGLGFAESLVFVSFFVPASALFLAIAALEGAAGNPLLPILFAGAAGCFVGDMVSYFLGRRIKGGTQSHWPFTRHPHWLSATQALFQRRGFSAIFISKFVGPLRPVVPFVAGAMHMSPVPFVGASIASSILWAMAFLIPSYYGIKFLGG